LKIGLFGFGRTGRLVAEEIIKNKDCELIWVVRNSTQNNHEFASDFLGYPKHPQGKFYCKEEVSDSSFFEKNRVDAIIDFSSSKSIYEYAHAVDLGIHIVSAISHYEQAELDYLQELAEKTAVMHSANITLGINFLLTASQILKQIIPEADIEIIEEHFREKRGASGTALKIAELLDIDKEAHVNSIRVGGIVGKHEVVFGLRNQTIRLTHEIISRAAFGAGALYAARSLQGAKPGFYTMEEIMREAFLSKIAVNNLL